MCLAGAHRPSATPLHTRSNVSGGCTRVQSRSHRIFQIQRVPRSPINRHVSKIFASVYYPANFSPAEEMEYLIEEERKFPGNAISWLIESWRPLPFHGSADLFSNFPRILFHRGFRAKLRDRISTFLESLLSQVKSLGILIEIDKKISHPPRWKIYAEYLSKYSISRNSIGIAKRVGKISFQYPFRSIEKFFQKSEKQIVELYERQDTQRFLPNISKLAICFERFGINSGKIR